MGLQEKKVEVVIRLHQLSLNGVATRVEVDLLLLEGE